MSWTYPTEYEGLPFQVDSGSPFVRLGEVVGFYIRDEQTVKAIRARDERILDVLNLMADEIEELSLARWASDWVALEHWRNDKSLDEYQQILTQVLNSRYADSSTKESVRTELDWVAQERQRQAQRAAKQRHSQRRRSQFSQNY